MIFKNDCKKYSVAEIHDLYFIQLLESIPDFYLCLDLFIKEYQEESIILS
ncbi:hypothetical protein M153_7300016705 [Pseudoloma neurophilia]|uniref:Uncharacterized protein n=1 Tax=Pseudoloma neurophilia TaxID=146866 RepID=A0A0R0M9M7_9MICR|nr:hypothetical protein M153_7300016705 [Pseudoloma neurophilia]